MPHLRSGLLGGALASVAFFSSANAADAYSSGLKDGGGVLLWEGPYFGVHGGGAWGSVDVTDVDFYSSNRGTFSNDGSGGFGGGTVGYNWQFGCWVYSAEIDAGVMDVSHTTAGPTASTISAHMDTGVYGDITGRAGYTFDGTLVYGKGGFGFFNGAATVRAAGVDQTFKSQSFTGWTLGGGVEYKITPNWSVKAEYLHFDVGTQQEHFINFGNRWNNSVTIDTVKAGLNYEILDAHAPLK